MFTGTFLRNALHCHPLVSGGLTELATYTAHPASVLTMVLEWAAEQGLILQFLSNTWVKKVTQPQA